MTARWVVIATAIRMDGGAAERHFLVADTCGLEPAFHPILSSRHDADVLCGALNRLGWTEDDYFDDGPDLEDAISAGTLEAFVNGTVHTDGKQQRATWRKLFAGVRAERR